MEVQEKERERERERERTERGDAEDDAGEIEILPDRTALRLSALPPPVTSPFSTPPHAIYLSLSFLSIYPYIYLREPKGKGERGRENLLVNEKKK
jgi:hypothetical protein